MAKKVLIFSLAYYPHLVGGAEVAVKEITERILPEEMEFDMVTLYTGALREERIGNINIHRVGPRVHFKGKSVPNISYFIKFQYLAYALLKALILHHRRHYDFIWSIMASFNGFSALFFKFAYPGVPFLLSLQEGDTIEHMKKSVGVIYPLYRRIFQKADRIQAISRFLADYGKSMGANCPIDIIPNGVNFKYFSTVPPAGQIKALAHELHIEPFDTVLITTSRLVQKNGVADIIESLAHLPPTSTGEVKLLILGTGPLETFLKEKTALLKLDSRVRFVGFVPHKEIPLYLHLSDIFIRPSLSEGMGVSFIEAMAAGLPVIATPVGGIPDFLIDGETGLFCRVNNPSSIAEKVEALINDEKLRKYITDKASEMVRQKYDWDLIAGEMRGIFDRI